LIELPKTNTCFPAFCQQSNKICKKDFSFELAHANGGNKVAAVYSSKKKKVAAD